MYKELCVNSVTLLNFVPHNESSYKRHDLFITCSFIIVGLFKGILLSY